MAAWIALYLLLGVLIVATLLALWEPSQRSTFDRHDWLVLASFAFVWPLVLLVLLVDFLDWPGFTR